jgi:hypothetical protein
MKTYLYPTVTTLPITIQHIFRWILLPLMLLTWSLTGSSQTIKTSSKKSVVLNWTAPVSANYSHFVIERSLNNVDFKEVGLLFTGEDDVPGADKNYTFSDNVKNLNKGIMLYYRINMVDMKGKVKNTVMHRVFNADQAPSPTVVATTNPATHDLKVALPLAWKDKYVSIELMNSAGQVVKYSLNQQSTPSETISMSGLTEGVYVLRVSNGTETVIQRVMKSK